MNNTLRFTVLFLAALVGSSTLVAAAESAAMQTETCATVSEQDISALFDRWNDSLLTGDAKKAVANYAEVSVLLPTLSNQPRLTPTEKEDYFKYFLISQPSGVIDSRTIMIDCNSALDTGLYTFVLGKSGEKVHARYTFTYHWDGSQWLITSHHSSAMPDPF